MSNLIARYTVRAILVASLSVISGCGLANFKDVSEQSQFAPLVGTSYTTKIPLIMHGVNMDEPIGKGIDQYSITGEPGIGGREIKARYSLPEGTAFEVKAIWECSDCYLDFSPRRKVEIKLISLDCYANHPVYFDAVWLDMEFLNLGNNNASLNSEFFNNQTVPWNIDDRCWRR